MTQKLNRQVEMKSYICHRNEIIRRCLTELGYKQLRYTTLLRVCLYAGFKYWSVDDVVMRMDDFDSIATAAAFIPLQACGHAFLTHYLPQCTIQQTLPN